MPYPSEVLIQFSHVSKQYVKRLKTIRESLSRWKDWWRNGNAGNNQSFWALRDINFTILRGETIGIIGDNGAGKSTILKLIAGISGPTEGRVTINGRVSSLIELGAGFNLELTGRENIYLNGAVLGMRRTEIDASMEKIMRFARVGDFLDMPVKYYSSGMYARLGFAIAANANADIILTDEILAVGDAAFQRQCLQRFRELQTSSTIVLVSHDLAKVKEVCSRVLWIKEGRLQCEGDPEKVVETYLQSVRQGREEGLQANGATSVISEERRHGSGEIEITGVFTCDKQNHPRSVFKHEDELVIQIKYDVKELLPDQGFGVKILSKDGSFVHGTNTFLEGMTLTLEKGAGTIELHYPRLPLVAGSYWLTVGATASNDWSAPYDLREHVRSFDVISARQDGGLVYLEHRWSAHAQVR